MVIIKGQIAGIDINSMPAYIDVLHGSNDSFIGYRVYCTKSTINALDGLKIATLELSQIIKEESNTLYGFIDNRQKECFNLLRTAKGIGGNTALLILDAVNDINDLYQAIADSDSEYFIKFKGVGKATADLIIKSLKKRVSKFIE